jgi:PQQ-dependent dehydrogenase (methanol/ethanol family)
MRKLSATVAIIAALMVSARVASAASQSEWPLLGGNSEQWQFSPLTLINDHNVATLGLAWSAELPVIPGLVGNPLVVDGTVYQGAPGGRIVANNVRNGKLLWTFQPAPRDLNDLKRLSWVALWANQVNRGLAVDEHNAYIASGDCRLFAVNRLTGRLLWEAAPCDPTKDYGIVGAPRVGGGMVFVGNTNAELGTERGHVDAYDAATGRSLWRFYTVPGNPADGFENAAMKMASKTWAPNYWRHGGAGAPWEGMAYDDKLRRLYVGVGNSAPIEADDAGKQMLFGNSIIALDTKTGRLLWYYQEAPGSLDFDCDAVAHIQIADLPTKKRERRVVMQAAKDGFFYVIDAHTGRLVSANNYVPSTWASHVDSRSGRLVTRAEYWKEPVPKVAQPGGFGARTWTLMAYNPNSRWVYVPAFIWPDLYAPPADSGASDTINYAAAGDAAYYGLSPKAKIKAAGKLIAWDPVEQRERWHVDQRVALNGGVLATAGNLVFEGTAEGTFNAYAADTGNRLWTFDAHGTILAAPTTVEIDDEQVILVPSGDGGATGAVPVFPRMTSTPSAQNRSRLLAFKLGGPDTVPAAPERAIPRPFRPVQPATLAKRGARLFSERNCFACHGLKAEKGGLAVPDLRTLSKEVYDAMPDIVIGGAYLQAGMPAFPTLTGEDLEAIRAFLTNEAWAAYDAQQGSGVHSGHEAPPMERMP